MPTEKELLLGFLSKALNLDDDGVASLIYNEDGSELKSDALKTLLDKQQKFIKKWKDDSSKFDQGYNKGKLESMTEFEKTLKEKFEIDSEKKGVELVEEFVESIRAKSGSKEVTDDDVKKHKMFIDREKQYRDELKRLKQEAADELKKVQDTFKQEKTFEYVVESALGILDGKKPILSTDPVKAKRQKQLLINELKALNYDVQGEGENRRIVPLTKEGKVLENTLGHAIDFAEMVNEKAELYYDFEQAEDRSAGGDPNKKGAPAGGAQGGKGATSRELHGVKLTKPANEQEFTAAFASIESNNLPYEQKADLRAALNELYTGQVEPATAK